MVLGGSRDGHDSSSIWAPSCLLGRGAFTGTGIILHLKLRFMLMLAPRSAQASCPATGLSVLDEIALWASTAFNFLKGCGFSIWQIGRFETSSSQPGFISLCSLFPRS